MRDRNQSCRRHQKKYAHVPGFLPPTLRSGSMHTHRNNAQRWKLFQSKTISFMTDLSLRSMLRLTLLVQVWSSFNGQRQTVRLDAYPSRSPPGSLDGTRPRMQRIA